MSYAGWLDDSIFVEYHNVTGYWDPDILKVQTACEAKGFDYLMTLSLSRRMAPLATPLWNPQNSHSITILWVRRKQMLYFRVLIKQCMHKAVLLSEGTLWTSWTKVDNSISLKHTFHCCSLLISSAYKYTTQGHTMQHIYSFCNLYLFFQFLIFLHPMCL